MIAKKQGGLHICYLDFDGVTHDDAVHWHPKRGIYISTPDRVLFEWAPILEDLLLPHPDVKIVLSTSWVRVKSFRYAKEKLSPALQERVIGATFNNGFMEKPEFERLSRGHQILADAGRRKPQRWFAIDNDDSGPQGYRDRPVKTDDRLGLSDPVVQNAICELLKLGILDIHPSLSLAAPA